MMHDHEDSNKADVHVIADVTTSPRLLCDLISSVQIPALASPPCYSYRVPGGIIDHKQKKPDRPASISITILNI